MRKNPYVIQAYKTAEWGEIAVLGALVAVLLFVIEGAFLASGPWAGLTVGTPFLAAALAFKHYQYEPAPNRVSASLVAAAIGIGLQVFIALILAG